MVWARAGRYLGHVELPEPEESDIAAIRKIMERAERRYE
jgi:hypothetical protein